MTMLVMVLMVLFVLFVAATSKLVHMRPRRRPIDRGTRCPAHASGSARSHVHVTLAKPDAGVDTQSEPATQTSTVHGSPSLHAASQVGVGGVTVAPASR